MIIAIVIFAVIIFYGLYVLLFWCKNCLEQFDKFRSENIEAQDLIAHMHNWSPSYFYFVENNNGIMEVHAKYLTNTDVCVKRYATDDAEYNRLCAEELVEKLNQKQ